MRVVTYYTDSTRLMIIDVYPAYWGEWDRDLKRLGGLKAARYKKSGG